MKFKKIPRTSLSGKHSKRHEVYNFHKFAAVMVEYGFDCVRVFNDWQGADLLALKQDGTLLKIQLKSRITINKKYKDKDLWMAFRARDSWYLIKHRSLVQKIRKHTPWLSKLSWTERGGYSSAGPSKKLLQSLEEDKLG